MEQISLIVPTLNESGNIGLLVERINATLFQENITYEIIIVDDYSTDHTQAIVNYLAKRFPISFYQKQGKPGKAQSLLEGFTYAKYDILCMIDADLQYAPEVIPAMLKRYRDGADIVIANRNYINVSTIRSFVSRSFYYFFGKLLHGLEVDVQSGLKLFKKEIIERLPLHPSPWTFDLEFLKKSIDAGYSIDFVTVDFTKRLSGKSKINLFKASWEIGKNAVRLKLRKREPILFHSATQQQKGQGFHYKGKEFIHFSSLSLHETAFRRLTSSQIILLIMIFLIITTGILLNWHLSFIVFFASIILLYFVDLLFNLILIMRSFSKPSEILVSERELQAINSNAWPVYTVFCPLYKEWQVIPQFVKAMSMIEYPKEKLQVMFLLEANDLETINAIKQSELPSYFEIVIVPDSQPKTKPKACNYGLTKARGEFAVIYDAEDIPDPLQLKKAVLAFKKIGEQTICLQAKLNFYNADQNFLTRLFTAEYSLWFELILTGLQSINAPIPLGGTSNHFKTAALRMLHGWDSFNVTEDADLGIRLAKRGYKTAIIDSQTLEEANSNLHNWFGQRSRWIKGYIQTYLVHTRSLKEFPSQKRSFNLLTFQLVIGGKILSLFINPLMWAMTLAYFALRPIAGNFITSFFPTPILYIGVVSLVVGNFLYLYYYMIGCAKHGHYKLIQYVYCVPFYWLLMSIASWIAVYQFITAPHYWSKTKHGLHLEQISEGFMTQTRQSERQKKYVGSQQFGENVSV